MSSTGSFVRRVIVPLAPLRAEASERSEQVSQLLYGQYIVEVSTDAVPGEDTAPPASEFWIKIESLDDGYIGWVDPRMLAAEEEVETPSASTSHGVLLQRPLTEVRIDGQAIFLPAGSCVSLEVAKSAKDVMLPKAASAVEAAEQFIGAPYLWGGKSILGMDCSGLIQLAGSLVGLALPRDASEQEKIGEDVAFEDLRSGDAVFFSKPETPATATTNASVTHVGWLVKHVGGLSVLHASSDVHVDELTPAGLVRDGQLTHCFYSGRRFA